MQSIKCNICNQENEKERHYCQKCGKNLSNLIEKTDVLFFFSGLLKLLGIIILILMVPGFIILEAILSLDAGNPKIMSLPALILSLIMFVISFFLKKYTLKLCKQNIKTSTK